MAEETTESPTLEEAEAEVKADETEVDDLMAELEKADIKTTEDLTNKLSVTKEYGHVVNQLGDLKRENRELREILQANQNRNRNEDYIDTDTREGVDLKDIMRDVIRQDREEQNKLQREAQQAGLQLYQKVTGHKHYGLIKKVYEAKLQDPHTMIQLNTGQTTYEDLFHDTLNEHWEGIARKSLETIKTLRGGGTGKEEPVHLETGTEIPGKSPGAEEKSEEELKGYLERVDSGGSLSEEEEADALLRILSR
jgi:uncharacterized protein YhaN